MDPISPQADELFASDTDVPTMHVPDRRKSIRFVAYTRKAKQLDAQFERLKLKGPGALTKFAAELFFAAHKVQTEANNLHDLRHRVDAMIAGDVDPGRFAATSSEIAESEAK